MKNAKRKLTQAFPRHKVTSERRFLEGHGYKTYYRIHGAMKDEIYPTGHHLLERAERLGFKTEIWTNGDIVAYV
jgi:hypothetical protein